jgi:hypothetical protein
MSQMRIWRWKKILCDLAFGLIVPGPRPYRSGTDIVTAAEVTSGSPASNRLNPILVKRREASLNSRSPKTGLPYKDNQKVIFLAAARDRISID